MKGQLGIAAGAALTVLFVLWVAHSEHEQMQSRRDPQTQTIALSRPPAGVHIAVTSLTRGVPETTIDACTGGKVGAVVGLWLINGNKKHRPRFYLNRLATVVGRIARQGWNLTLVTNSADAAKIASAEFTKLSANTAIQAAAALNVRRMDVAELPYATQASAVDPHCPTKYGKALPRGALQALNRLWLSKVWVLASSSRAAAAAAQESGGCKPRSWAWFDAGLNADEVQRATESIEAAAETQSRPSARVVRCKAINRADCSLVVAHDHSRMNFFWSQHRIACAILVLYRGCYVGRDFCVL